MFFLVNNQNDQVRNYLTEKMRPQHGANKFHQAILCMDSTLQADRPKGDLRKFSLTVSLQYKAEGRQLLSGGTVTAESRAL